MEIRSDRIVFPNRGGRKIVAYLDSLAQIGEHEPFVVMTPKFGESKKNNLQLAYYLAANGMHTFRFDHTNHIGESDGTMVDYTFGGSTDDILECVRYLDERFKTQEIILLANSISVRCAIRAARLDSRVARVVSIVGVVNFRDTAREVYQDDMVGNHLNGEAIGVSDILGHDVDVTRFLDDCIGKDMHDLEGTVADIRRASSDFFFFCAEKDTWVRKEDIQALALSRDDLYIRWIPDAMHELRENPDAAERAIRETVFVCKHGRFPRQEELETLRTPSRKQLFAQNRLERDLLRKANPLTESESEFWQTYLDKYTILEQVTDFQEYLNLIGDCLGPFRPGDCLFDVGCGNGLFGVWCIRRLMERKPWSAIDRPVYFGLDLTPHGLSEAADKHAYAQCLAADSVTSSSGWLDFLYLPYDLDVVGRRAGGHAIELPFEDQTFDKLCCSLLLSYLSHPARLLAECHRVLKPGGTLVISSMKPFCDLSVLYKDVVEDTDDAETRRKARNLLSAAGAIRMKEEQGHYTFYTLPELESLAAGAGFKDLRGFRSFGDQANLVAGRR